MIREWIDSANRDQAVYISDVRKDFMVCGTRPFHIHVLLYDGGRRGFPLMLPETKTAEEADFLEEFVCASVHNLLSALGARQMEFYLDPADQELRRLAERLPDIFQLSVPASARTGHGKCVSVNERVLHSLAGEQEPLSFRVLELDREPEALEGFTQAAEYRVPVISACCARTALRATEEGVYLGIDVGGSDIKLAAGMKGKLVACKEYDWNPSVLGSAWEVIEPILLLTELMLTACALERAVTETRVEPPFGSEDENNPFRGAAYLKDPEIRTAFRKHASAQKMRQAIERMRQELKALGYEEPLLFDGIGISFPDVVIGNRIVGGETSKSRGIRENYELNYEAQLLELSDLCGRMAPYVKDPGRVVCINDGNMAAFTAAVEQSAAGADLSGGLLGHTLGTDLGTGWVLPDGTIAACPLEIYNLIIDLGSRRQREYPAEDVRSNRNYSNDLPGTLQRYASQSGIFRLAATELPRKAPSLCLEMTERGLMREENGLLMVPVAPEDRRKECVEYFMAMASAGEPEVCAQIFRTLGEYLAVAWEETQYLLQPGALSRALFGRLVKTRECFRLITEGAHQRVPSLVLTAADRNFAVTPMMKQLGESPMYTVAQFGQAVGGIYYAAAFGGEREAGE